MHRDGLIGLIFSVKLCEDKQIKLLGNYRFIFAQLSIKQSKKIDNVQRCGNTSQRQIGGTTLGRYTKLMQRAKEGEKFYVHSINNRWK